MTIRAAIFAYIGLVALLALTVGSSLLPLGAANGPINLLVAVAKAALIAVVFMHLRRAPTLAGLAVVTLLVWLCFLYGLTILDVATR